MEGRRLTLVSFGFFGSEVKSVAVSIKNQVLKLLHLLAHVAIMFVRGLCAVKLYQQNGIHKCSILPIERDTQREARISVMTPIHVDCRYVLYVANLPLFAMQVLEAFSSGVPPLSYLVELIPRLRPRQFSISSSLAVRFSRRNVFHTVTRHREGPSGFGFHKVLICYLLSFRLPKCVQYFRDRRHENETDNNRSCHVTSRTGCWRVG